MTHIIQTVVIALVALMSANAFTVSNSYSTKTQLKMTVLTYNGKKMDFPAGSPLSSACAKLGVKPKYSCKK